MEETPGGTWKRFSFPFSSLTQALVTAKYEKRKAALDVLRNREKGLCTPVTRHYVHYTLHCCLLPKCLEF